MCSDQDGVLVISRPFTLHMPPWTRLDDAGGELVFAIAKLFIEVRADEFDVPSRGAGSERHLRRQKRCKPADVIAPEDSLDLGEISLVEEGAFAGRLDVDAADVEVESIFLGNHGDVRAIAAKLLADLVPDIGGNRDGGSGDGDTEHDRQRRHQLAPALQSERLID